MSIKYTVVENSLKEGTYFSRVIPDSVLDISALSYNITSKTTLTEGTIRAVISALREEIIGGLIRGNSIKIDDLMTISVSLRGALEHPNAHNNKDTDLFINTRISRLLYDDVRNLAHFVRVVKPPKLPIMVSIQSLSQCLMNYYMPGAPLRISGNNLKFHPRKDDEGIVCIKADGTSYRIPFYSVVGNKRIDFTISENIGDIKLRLSVRYGNSQESRSEKYGTTLKLMIATAFEDTVIVRNYEGTSGTATLTIDKDTGELTYLANGDTAGISMPIHSAGTYILVSGTATNFIEVDIVDYDAYRLITAETEIPTAQITLS